jgi:PPOX class probable FMN-dependent enzyme
MMSNEKDVTKDEQLDELYARPSENILKAIAHTLHAHHRAYLEKATFFSFATVRNAGLDVTPRGGPPGFVRVLDDRTIAFGDWPGNNKIESMRNLVHDNRVATVFIFPGLEIFLRINGTARISTDRALLSKVAEGGRLPKTAIVVSIEELIFHCGKAINRAGLWKKESQIDRKELPSVGVIMRDLAGTPSDSVGAVDEHYDESVKNDLYESAREREFQERRAIEKNAKT